jgi:hypothetical protein
MNADGMVFNPPPGWPRPPEGWRPPKGWTPDPSWPKPPDGWDLWVPAERSNEQESPGYPVEPEEPQAPEFSEPLGGGPQSNGEAVLIRKVALLEAENAAMRSRLDAMETEPDGIVGLDDDRILQAVGIYRYHHPLEDAVAYRERLDELAGRIADLVKRGDAIEKSNMFTFDNSLAKGRKMSADLAKLMLRAYNAEADNAIRSLRAGNVVTAKKRLEASRTAIAKLGSMMEMRISNAFHALRVEELELTSDYLMKKQEEREAAREERERLREERKVAAELAAERDRLNKERTHLVNALEALRAGGSTDPDLETKLSELDAAIARNDYRTANIRAGYVYVISNRGAFGEGVVKIGLTRRLEPMDRINELGDASVPFRFDVHALFFSEDAVTLEAELHRHFADRRLNLANLRREFFFATPTQVRDVLNAKLGNLLEFTEHAESLEYLQSVGQWPELHVTPGPAEYRSSEATGAALTSR